MSWGGKGKGWNCYTCGFLNWGTHCAKCQHWGMKGAYPKGKGKNNRTWGIIHHTRRGRIILPR
eukprot:13336278-Heterocapsa_arctica.AAC.1